MAKFFKIALITVVVFLALGIIVGWLLTIILGDRTKLDEEFYTSSAKSINESTTTVSCTSLMFSVRNTGERLIKDVTIFLPDTTLYYSMLESYSQSFWTCVKSTYSYAKITYKDQNDSCYILQPKDYIGEPLFTNGRMTYVLNYNATERKYEWTFTLKP